MAVDLRTTQEYLNEKAGTVGLTKQQCLQILAGPTAVGATAQDAARRYAGSGPGEDTRSIQTSLKQKVGGATAYDVDITTQGAARRL